MNTNATRTVRELAVEIPGATRIFEKKGIDYCCGGGKSLKDACASAGVAVADIMQSLAEASAPEGATDYGRWASEPLAKLAAYIVNRHHVFTREEMDRLEALLARVCSKYAERRPEVVRVRALFMELKAELTTHMLKEEQVLFPYIQLLEAATTNAEQAPRAFFGTVRNPVHMMMTEHDRAGDMLKEIRSLTSDFTAPEDVCITYRTLYRSLEGLETDLHEHIHLENNILFPRAVEMEEAIGLASAR